MKSFGERITELRQASRMTQVDLGKAMFVSSGTISNYEKGVHYPDVEKLVELADYFDVTTDYLLGRSVTKLSPDVLNQEYVDGKTIGEMVRSIQQLTPARKRILNSVLEDMALCALMERKRGREE